VSQWSGSLVRLALGQNPSPRCQIYSYATTIPGINDDGLALPSSASGTVRPAHGATEGPSEGRLPVTVVLVAAQPRRVKPAGDPAPRRGGPSPAAKQPAGHRAAAAGGRAPARLASQAGPAEGPRRPSAPRTRPLDYYQSSRTRNPAISPRRLQNRHSDLRAEREKKQDLPQLQVATSGWRRSNLRECNAPEKGWCTAARFRGPSGSACSLRHKLLGSIGPDRIAASRFW
jgi:hypothetical protein